MGGGEGLDVGEAGQVERVAAEELGLGFVGLGFWIGLGFGLKLVG